MPAIRYTEGFLPCMPAIARRILAANIQNECTPAMRELQALAVLEAAEAAYLYVAYQQVGGHASCSLSVRLEPGRDRALDSDGNEWIEFRAKFDINWPSHGSSTPAQAAARVALFDEVVRLATRLQAEFGDRPIMNLYRTATEIAEDKAKAAASQAQRAAEALAKDGMTHNLRVGGWSGSRQVDAAKLPPGDYLISNGTRRYQMCVRQDSIECLAKIVRLADEDAKVDTDLDPNHPHNVAARDNKSTK